MLPIPHRIELLGGTHEPPRIRTIHGLAERDLPPSLWRRLHLVAAAPEDAWLSCRIDPSLQVTRAGHSSHRGGMIAEQCRWQGYELTLAAGAAANDSAKPSRICLTAASPDGLRHGLHTLAQLLILHESAIPAQRIIDCPAFPIRGVMLDVSRDRIPTMVEFQSLIETLASLKFNHLQLYTEHTFAYSHAEPVWRGTSPLTPDEVRRLDSLCASNGIELAANQNCFGHMVPWLTKEPFKHLAETHGDWMFDIWPRSGPFSLCPTDPASATFIATLLDELLPCFTSRRVNIGCDEVYDIAFGRSKEQAAQRGRAAVYLEFVNTIASLCRARGKTAQVWGDIALTHPESLQQLAPDITLLAWGYEADSPFEKWGQLLEGRDFWVCPGTSTWRSITGRTTERTGNIAAAAKAGVAHSAPGFLICDWGDSGHQQQWPITLHALGQAAQAAWNPDSASMDATTPAARADASRILFGAPDVGPWLDELGDADLPLRQCCGALSHPSLTRLKNQTAIFIDLFKQLDEQVAVGPTALWFETLDRLEALAARIPTTASALINDELAFTADHACFAAARGALRRDGACSRQSLLGLRDTLADLQSRHERLWKVRSRSGGLAHSLSFFSQINAIFVKISEEKAPAHANDGSSSPTMFE